MHNLYRDLWKGGLFFFFLFCGCSNTSCWQVDAIATGDPRFNSTRLRYISPEKSASLTFEMRKVGDEIGACLNLTKFPLSPDCVKLLLTINGESYDVPIVPHEGLMKVLLPPDVTNLIVQALRAGEKVGILIDDFEEKLEPEHFASAETKFLGKGFFFQDLFKGPLQ